MPSLHREFVLFAASASSGSTHQASSLCLQAMVDEFFENQFCDSNDVSRHSPSDRYELLDVVVTPGSSPQLQQSFESLLRKCGGAVGGVQGLLFETVDEAMELEHVHEAEGTRRMVVAHIQSAGNCNAAVCKSRWPGTCGLAAGEYEYIDVIFEQDLQRIVVDIDFRAQFEIARATPVYSHLLKLLPRAYVGPPETLKQIVEFMGEAMKQSLKVAGMPLPPWRRTSYLLGKWFSPYTRTSNQSLSNPTAALNHLV